LEHRFHGAHEQRYGYRMDSEPVQIVNARLTATVEVDKPALREQSRDRDRRVGCRSAYFDGKWDDVALARREQMGAGMTVAGPAIVELKESTCVVRPGWSAALNETGTLILEKS
jgi:N-methylhydantoinase A